MLEEIKVADNQFEMVVKSVVGLPMIRIERDDFLEKELSKYCPQEQVQTAVEQNPASAGIDISIIDKIANSCINYETNKASAISFATGVPGGFVMLGTIPADITQFFGHILRIMQKLIYLYGWEDLFDCEGNLDDETLNMLTLFIGIMFSVNGAASTISKISLSAAQKANKSLASKALTKGAVYPVVKKISGIKT